MVQVMDSKQLKLEIVKHWQVNHMGKGYLEDPVVQVWGLGDDEKEFLSDYTPEEMARLQEGYKAAQNPNNWKRHSKRKIDDFHRDENGEPYPHGTILRVFDLAPAEDQIRAYTYVTPDGKLYDIDIVGE